MMRGASGDEFRNLLGQEYNRAARPEGLKSPGKRLYLYFLPVSKGNHVVIRNFGGRMFLAQQERKIANGVLKDVVYIHDKGVLYFQNGTRCYDMI
jgi:hypothetical protein